MVKFIKWLFEKIDIIDPCCSMPRFITTRRITHYILTFGSFACIVVIGGMLVYAAYTGQLMPKH